MQNDKDKNTQAEVRANSIVLDERIQADLQDPKFLYSRRAKLKLQDIKPTGIYFDRLG